MPEFIYSMHNVRKSLGDKVVLDNVTLSFYPGAKIGVVGPNGTGKSTLLKLMAGLEKPSNGDAMLAKEATVGILLQEPPLTEDKTVLENVEEAVADTKRLLTRMDELGAAMAEPDADFDALMAEMGDVQTELDHRNAWDIDSQLEQAMDALRCPPPDAPVDVLSGGERRRVALCKLLLQQPDLLLLDEPTNHLDAESVHWLEGHLKAYPGAVLAVTHDRYFLDNVAEWILELDRGRTHPYEGNYSTYLDTKKARLQIEGKRDAKRAKILERELEWARSNPKARQAKNKARLARYEELAAEAERNRKLDFEEINIPPGPRLGSNVLDVRNLVKGFGDRTLFDGLSFNLPRAGIVGVVGPNGVGKSTLFRMIIGEEQPDAGELKLGETVKISYVDQGRTGLDPKKNVWELVSDGLDHIKVASFEMPSRAYVASFGFKGPDQQKPAGVLSGGERNRLNLALTLKMGGNLLLLDEPTNDLDVETLQSLEDALLEFPGCAVVISHDRWFLDRVATHILAWEGDDENQAQWFWFEGNFANYEANKIARLGAEAARPHRATHRRLTRG
ncbi:putative ABC transporter ATP-binding protein [Microlunatus phosphovorus NM-1]|uniref:Energy-dependent translational throttle protein EttA n=1 Tax=Microlunatus phosphovorus (strain ATCC 700054 / DSM 10555 / JCM 9379 / NBRC 101784 / NCIMB 13414 / VKM Ac-1990 / NM-1) TaxID=1032480 RepID=F5XP86_MICPN|nr:energy-dependent translational throttle protein EttA [Microlunatus phosphovorus]BAK36726.1 putative ABC transporter ATP-binding protein [Microlunatus phosphovorus NM-1]